MKCLFLDLASHDALVACVMADAVIASEFVHARISDADLIPLVEQVLKAAGWEYKDIDAVACIVGPGGFTSLRVAVAFANTLGDQLGIPVAGIHLSELYRARVESGKWKVENVHWVHSTKRDQLFICGGTWVEPTLINLTDKPEGEWMGELIDDHKTSDPISLLPVIEVLPSFLGSLKYQKKLLEPWYGRGW